MAANRSSSDSSGGALLRSGALEATPQQDDRESTRSSESPTDDEMALVQASDKFNRLANDAHGYRPLVAADEYHQGHQLQRPPTTHPGQSPFGQNIGVPPNIASSPLYRGFGDIQARLVTAQQYVRITPGFTNEQAQTVQQLLVGVGQDLTRFATTVIQEHTKSQHQAGDLRVQYEKAQNELLSRRKQILELQEQYKELALEKDLEAKTVASLERQIESHQGEVKRLQKLTKDYDHKHAKQVQSLEDEIKSLRLSQGTNMQLVKLSNTPQNKASHVDSDRDEEQSLKKNRTPAPERRKSSLDPTAPEFGPRSSKTDHSKEMLPLLRKYANEGAAKAAGRGLESQDSRAYGNNSNKFEPSRHTPTRMGFRGGSSGISSGPNNAFNANSRALVPSNPQQQGRFRSTAEFINVDHSKLQNKVEWSAEDVTLGFVRLFGMIEGLVAQHHVQPPFNESDNMLMMSHPATWNYILSMGLKNQAQSASHMLDLLTRFDYRHYVMKRIILDYIINRIIVPEVFFGFNEAIDNHLNVLQNRMKSRVPGQNGPNIARPQGLERQRIVTDHAKVIQFIIEAPEHEDFKKRMVAKHTQMLSSILRPVRSCSVEDEQADKALSIVVNAAYTVSTRIWVSGMTLHYYFPETGSKFAYGTMRSLNYVDVPSDQMQYQQYRIMLVVTPTLSLRDDRDMDRLRTHELLKADVLVMR
ncbi:hypothetical protein TruAng_008567 [Truncatella angustata]|nr:hypothetical protein TruAng_008567 [Truncatella angustata]